MSYPRSRAVFGVNETSTEELDVWEREIRDVLLKEPILGDFAQYLVDTGCYGWGDLKDLLLEEWDGAIPTSILGDDLLDDIAGFIYYLHDYCLERVVGKENRSKYSIVVWPSYEDYTYAVIYHRESKTVVLEWSKKTWHFSSEEMEEEILDIQKQISEGVELVKRRVELGV